MDRLPAAGHAVMAPDSSEVPFAKGEGYYSGVRTDLVRLVPRISGRVLEIGCAGGLTLEYLRRNFDCDAVGLDYSEEAAGMARARGFDVRVCDLNSQELPFDTGEFDYILIGDVLEHLYDPWKVLTAVTRILKDDGTILLSIPNVKHYSLLKHLILRDRWEYTESGLLDVTHIRFFTLKSIRGLLSRSGLVVSGLEYNVVGSGIMRVANRLCLNLLHSFLVLHYLVAAKKRPRG